MQSCTLRCGHEIPLAVMMVRYGAYSPCLSFDPCTRLLYVLLKAPSAVPFFHLYLRFLTELYDITSYPYWKLAGIYEKY